MYPLFESIKYLNNLTKIVKLEEIDAAKAGKSGIDVERLKRQQPTNAEEDILKFFTFYRDLNDFMNFKHEFIDINGKRYKIYYEIDENDLTRKENKNRPLDFRKTRWYIMDDNGTPKVYYITVSENSDGGIVYSQNKEIINIENETITDSEGNSVQTVNAKSHQKKSAASTVTKSIFYITNSQILNGNWNGNKWAAPVNYKYNLNNIYPKISPMDYVFIYM